MRSYRWPLFCLVGALILLSVAAAAERFHARHRGETSKGFESIAHYQDLYLGDKRVGVRVGQVSVSPSGRFVLFEENGKLFLADRGRKHRCDVTDGSFSVPEKVSWSEERSTA